MARGLRVRVGNLPDVQCLFAVETLTARPVGVAVYNRADLEHVTVLHLGHERGLLHRRHER